MNKVQDINNSPSIMDYFMNCAEAASLLLSISTAKDFIPGEIGQKTEKGIMASKKVTRDIATSRACRGYPSRHTIEIFDGEELKGIKGIITDT